MVQINFGSRQISCKIVYYGPGLGGKTTNLRVIHEKAPSDHRGDLTSIATEGDRTLFFDFLPIELGTVRGMTTKFQLYTVPGQVYYNATRKLVLTGADGIVFVADSQKGKMEENKESFLNLEENLREHGVDIREIPIVFQFNKRDLPEIDAAEEMNKELNRLDAPHFESVAIRGEGVFPTLRTCLKLVLANLEKGRLADSVRPGAQVEPGAEVASARVQAVPAQPDSPPEEPAPVAGDKAKDTIQEPSKETPPDATVRRQAPKPRPVGRRVPRTVGAAGNREGGAGYRPVYVKAPRHGLPVWVIVALLGVCVGVIVIILWRSGILASG